ncbi:2006_t:CDS:2, partial [Funneliformis caledonium]
KNLAGRRGALEIKLNDETQSTEGYWNSTREWVYPIALNIIAKPTLDLVIQCRYTEHERALTKIYLGPEGSHEHIWKRLMDGPYEMKQISLHDNDHDAAKIGLLLSVHENVSPKTLFNMDDESTTTLHTDTSVSEIPTDEESIKRTLSTKSSTGYGRRPIPPGPIQYRKPLIPEGTQSIPYSRHRSVSIDDDDFESASQTSHVPVSYSPPRSVVDMDCDINLRKRASYSSSTGSPTHPQTPPQSSQGISSTYHTSPASSIFSIPPRKQHTTSSPPPSPAQNPHPKNDGLRFVCQRYVIVNQLRLGRRREESNLLYKGNHILSGLNVIIKEFNSKMSWEIETQYLKELASKHLVRWVDKSSNESTREYFSITEYY